LDIAQKTKVGHEISDFFMVQDFIFSEKLSRKKEIFQILSCNKLIFIFPEGQSLIHYSQIFVQNWTIT